MEFSVSKFPLGNYNLIENGVREIALRSPHEPAAKYTEYASAPHIYLHPGLGNVPYSPVIFSPLWWVGGGYPWGIGRSLKYEYRHVVSSWPGCCTKLKVVNLWDRFHWKRTNEPIVEIYGFPLNGDALWLNVVRIGYYAVSYWHEDAWCWLERCLEPIPVAGHPFDLSEYKHITSM